MFPLGIELIVKLSYKRPFIQKFAELAPNENGCIEWPVKSGHNSSGKYRRSYETFIGPIPAGLHVCHTCDNPHCINPEHLWIGTASDNIQDSIRKGRFTACGPKVLTMEQVNEIIERRRLGESAMDLGFEYGVGRNLIYRIEKGKTGYSPNAARG
jgi:hypothetical protein